MLSVDPHRMDAHARACFPVEPDPTPHTPHTLPTSRAIQYAALGFAGDGERAPAKARAIVLVVREGVSVRAASRETGVSPSTVYRLVAGFRATLSRHALAASTLRRRG